jgi:hypothetical protein
MSLSVPAVSTAKDYCASVLDIVSAVISTKRPGDMLAGSGSAIIMSDRNSPSNRGHKQRRRVYEDKDTNPQRQL